MIGIGLLLYTLQWTQKISTKATILFVYNLKTTKIICHIKTEKIPYTL